MSEIYIKNAKIVTMDPNNRIIENGFVHIKDDYIVDIGKGSKSIDGGCVIDAEGDILLPGLVNTHTHLFQTLGKGLGSDSDLLGWFKGAWEPIAKALNKELYETAILASAIESIHSGTTSLLAYEHILSAKSELLDVVVSTIKKMGIRTILGIGYQDQGFEIGAPRIAVQPTDEIISFLEDSLNRYHTGNDMFRIWLAPGTMNWISDDLIRATKDLANQFNTGITIHMDETQSECNYSLKTRGVNEIMYAYKTGLLDDNVLVVHGVWADDQSIQAIAKSNAKYSHNPVSNCYLASGIAPLKKYLDAGIMSGLATDGAASNNTLDMFEVIRLTGLIHKGYNRNPKEITSEQILRMATINGARAILMDNIGSIEIGKKADLIIIDGKSPNILPIHNLISNIVYAFGRTQVKTSIINGRIVMENGKILHLNESEIIEKLYKITKKLSDDLSMNT